MAKCFYHKRRDAVGACVNCRKLICADCEVTLKNKIYCNPCVEQMFGEKAAAASVPPVAVAEETAPAKAMKKPAAKVEVAAATTADNTSGQGKGAALPQEVRGWNWGAFLLNWLWGMGNSVWIALLTFILGPIMAIILGVKGNEWAWRNKKWKNVEHFKKTQRAWTWAGVALFCVPIVLAVLVIALGGQPEPTTFKWKEQQTIKQPLTVNMAGQDVVLGRLDNHQVEIKIPGTAFEQPVQVTVKNAKKAPAVPSAEFTPLGALIEIDTGELPARLYELATITFKIDKASMESHPDPGAYWVAHYTGSEWEYIKPDEVNLVEGTISIQTDHFSLWGWGEVSVDERIEQYTKNKAVAEWAQDEVDEKLQEAVGNFFQHMCQGFGMKEEMKRELLVGVFADEEYGNLIKSVQGGDETKFSENLAKLAGNNMKRLLDKNELDRIGRIKNPLGLTLEKADDVAQFAGALGHAYEGDYRKAAEIMGDFILKKSPVGQAILIAKEAGEDLAQFLNDRMFEQAYQVYSTGSTAGMGIPQKWNYRHVERGDFNQVWDQSHYVSRVLIGRYKEKGFGDKEAKAAAKEYLENLFKEREKREAEIAQKQDEIKDLIDLFQKEAADDSNIKDFLYPKVKGWLRDSKAECPPDKRLDELLEIVDIIKRETGTTKVGGAKGPGVLQTADLVYLASHLIQAWKEGKGADYRSPEYLETIKGYTFRITASQDILEGKGVTGTSYSFEAKGKNIPLIAMYIWSYSYGGKESKPTETVENKPKFTFPSAGKYTLKCVAWWSGEPIGPQKLQRFEKVAELTFDISEQAELKISVSPAMQSGKGEAGTRYTFTATGKGIPANAVYTWSLNYGGNDKVQKATGSTLAGLLESPGKYTLKCLAKWIEKTSSGQQVDREAVATPLTFDILAAPLTISPNPLNGEVDKPYSFTAAAAGAPAGASYQWYVDDKLMTGNTDKNTITFRDEGTYDIDVKLVQEGQVLAQGQAKANIKASTPTPPPTQQVPLKAKGSLKIGSVPAGADIYINGQKQAYQTPANYPNVEAGTYTVGLKKAGYKDYSATAIVAEGRPTELWAKLEAVESKPAPSPHPTPTPTPKPAERTPQEKCDCVARYQQTVLAKQHMDACKKDRECISAEVRITKPWTYNPATNECVGSYEYWSVKTWYEPKGKAQCTGRYNDMTVSLEHAEKRCQELGK